MDTNSIIPVSKVNLLLNGSVLLRRQFGYLYYGKVQSPGLLTIILDKILKDKRYGLGKVSNIKLVSTDETQVTLIFSGFPSETKKVFKLQMPTNPNSPLYQLISYLNEDYLGLVCDEMEIKLKNNIPVMIILHEV